MNRNINDLIATKQNTQIHQKNDLKKYEREKNFANLYEKRNELVVVGRRRDTKAIHQAKNRIM